jgi:hypothetical protein
MVASRTPRQSLASSRTTPRSRASSRTPRGGGGRRSDSAPQTPSVAATASKSPMSPAMLRQRLLRVVYREAREVKAISQQTSLPLPHPGTPCLPSSPSSTTSPKLGRLSLQQAGNAVNRGIGNVKTMALVAHLLGGKLDDDTVGWLNEWTSQAASKKQRRQSEPMQDAEKPDLLWRRLLREVRAYSDDEAQSASLERLSSEEQLRIFEDADTAFQATVAQMQKLLDDHRMSRGHGEYHSSSSSDRTRRPSSPESAESEGDSDHMVNSSKCHSEASAKSNAEPCSTKPAGPSGYVRSPLVQRRLQQRAAAPGDIDTSGLTVTPPATPHPQSQKQTDVASSDINVGATASPISTASPSDVEMQWAAGASPISAAVSPFGPHWRKVAIDESSTRATLPDLRGRTSQQIASAIDLARWRADSPPSPGGWPTLEHEEAAKSSTPWTLGDAYIGEMCPSNVRQKLEKRRRASHEVPLAIQLPAVQVAGPSWVGRLPSAAIKSPRSHLL